MIILIIIQYYYTSYQNTDTEDRNKFSYFSMIKNASLILIPIKLLDLSRWLNSVTDFFLLGLLLNEFCLRQYDAMVRFNNRNSSRIC